MSYEARGKFGEHERSVHVRVARGDRIIVIVIIIIIIIIIIFIEEINFIDK